MNFNCPKCGSKKFVVKNVILPDKNKFMKVELNLYYAKTCLNCGYTEFYLASIVDEDIKKEKEEKNADKKSKVGC